MDGGSVSSAGDINGDGIDDLLIGSTGYGGQNVYVVFGNASGFGADFDLTTLDGSNGFELKFASTDPKSLGKSVSSAGDVNGDGIDDIIVGTGAPFFYSTPDSAAYVVFGKTGGFDASIDPSHLDGSDGFSITGAGDDAALGRSVASAGDINGDGFDDLIIGSPYADPNGLSSGAAFVVFGTDTGFAANVDVTSLDGSNGFTVNGAAAFDRLGNSVASAGDVNGDGFDDLFIGRSVIFGKAGGFDAVLELADLTGANGFRITGAGTLDGISSAGDINGDGFGDLIIGKRVILGKAEVFSATFDLSTLDGSNGFTMIGQVGDGLGGAVSGAGDINGDGFDDLVVGASGTDFGAYDFDQGAAYVIFGHATGVINRSGTSGSDILSGGEFNDSLRGLGGEDWLRGNDGVDSLKGGGGDDLIEGGAGIDVLQGGGGKDEIHGGAGSDRITGGFGKDTLSGGADKDRFIFTAIADSKPGTAAYDEITDFTVVAGTGAAFIDRIDLSAIDAKDGEAGHQAFRFIGTAGFTGEGQIRAVQDGTDTKLVINTQGSNGAEMTILLKDFTATTLTAADFIL